MAIRLSSVRSGAALYLMSSHVQHNFQKLQVTCGLSAFPVVAGNLLFNHQHDAYQLCAVICLNLIAPLLL